MLAKHLIIPDKVFSFVQLSPLIDPINVQEIGFKSNWTTPLVFYLKDDTLSDGKEAARKLKVQVARFILIKDILYKRGFSCPYLRCLSREEADYVMREVHEGICKKMPRRTSKPTINVKSSAISSDNRRKSSPNDSPWPFAQWGLDIMGPFPIAMRQLKFLIVDIDNFTKWVEVETLATFTEKTCEVLSGGTSFVDTGSLESWS